MSADPNNQNRNTVHDKHHNRHHKGHRAVGKQLGLKQILIRLIKALFLVLFPTKCANRHNAGQHFTGDQIQAVYQLLHDFGIAMPVSVPMHAIMITTARTIVQPMLEPVLTTMIMPPIATIGAYSTMRSSMTDTI